MSKEVILGLIRHVLTAGGGVLATKGVVDSETAGIIIGALITIAGAIWSVMDKNKAKA